MELALVKDLCGTFCFSMQFVVMLELFGTVVLPAAIIFTVIFLYNIAHPAGSFLRDSLPPLMMLLSILILPAVLVAAMTRRWVYLLWMLVYLSALPIWNFVLPVYAFWHFDDFSWGMTRMVEGETGKDDHGKKEGTFDGSSIPMYRWIDWQRMYGKKHSASAKSRAREEPRPSSRDSRRPNLTVVAHPLGDPRVRSPADDRRIDVPTPRPSDRPTVPTAAACVTEKRMQAQTEVVAVPNVARYAPHPDAVRAVRPSGMPVVVTNSARNSVVLVHAPTTTRPTQPPMVESRRPSPLPSHRNSSYVNAQRSNVVPARPVSFPVATVSPSGRPQAPSAAPMQMRTTPASPLRDYVDSSAQPHVVLRTPGSQAVTTQVVPSSPGPGSRRVERRRDRLASSNNRAYLDG